MRADRLARAREAQQRRYVAARQDAAQTAREGGGFGEDLVEVSDYEADDRYTRALAEYKAARARGGQGQGYAAVARRYRIPAVRLKKMYNRDVERQRHALETSSDSGSGPC